MIENAREEECDDKDAFAREIGSLVDRVHASTLCLSKVSAFVWMCVRMRACARVCVYVLGNSERSCFLSLLMFAFVWRVRVSASGTSCLRTREEECDDKDAFAREIGGLVDRVHASTLCLSKVGVLVCACVCAYACLRACVYV